MVMIMFENAKFTDIPHRHWRELQRWLRNGGAGGYNAFPVQSMPKYREHY
jgi:hypothetical protein